ncbi:MAG: hypothetical protein SWJ54_21975 [Cyanobacteriota bacterium]|nr:hypothetical protein [Cyanobacteriota bacterium]
MPIRRLNDFPTIVRLKFVEFSHPSYLAKYTQLSQPEAQNFIEKKAIELNATIKIKPDGETIYHFPLN